MSTLTVTTEQVHELIEQLAAMTAAASITPQMVANIFENMRQLNDQEREKVIAIAEAYIAEIENTGISAEKVFLDDGTGQNVADALSQRPLAVYTPSLKDDSGAELSFADDRGNIVMDVSGGHVKTKNFDSENVKLPSITTIDNENFLIFS